MSEHTQPNSRDALWTTLSDLAQEMRKDKDKEQARAVAIVQMQAVQEGIRADITRITTLVEELVKRPNLSTTQVRTLERLDHIMDQRGRVDILGEDEVDEIRRRLRTAPEHDQANHRLETALDEMQESHRGIEQRLKNLEGLDARFDKLDARLDTSDAQIEDIRNQLYHLEFRTLTADDNIVVKQMMRWFPDFLENWWDRMKTTVLEWEAGKGANRDNRVWWRRMLVNGLVSALIFAPITTVIVIVIHFMLGS